MVKGIARLTALVVVAAYSLPAYAHDFWIERQPGDGAFVLRYGHVGGEALPLEAAKLQSLMCRNNERPAENLLGKAVIAPKKVSLAATCAIATAFFDGGFWSLTPDGEKNLPKDKVPDAVKAWRSKQFAKWVDIHSPLAGQAQGDEFEIVPASDLAKVKTGDKATFRVLLSGKPIEGAVLSVGHKPLGETDDQGRVRVKIRSESAESVSATFRRPVKIAQADSEVFEASLTFEVGR
jgi:uncharacterized GH25 family protein